MKTIRILGDVFGNEFSLEGDPNEYLSVDQAMPSLKAIYRLLGSIHVNFGEVLRFLTECTQIMDVVELIYQNAMSSEASSQKAQANRDDELADIELQSSLSLIAYAGECIIVNTSKTPWGEWICAFYQQKVIQSIFLGNYIVISMI